MTREREAPRWSITSRAIVLTAVPMAFQLVLLVVIAMQQRTEARERAAELRSQEILGSAWRLSSLVVDVESGLRGLLLTGQAPFAEPYVRGAGAASSELAHLRALLDGTPRRTGFDLIERSVRPVLAHYALSYQLATAGRVEEARRLVERGTGRLLMSGFRQTMDAFVNEQKERDMQRRREVILAERRSQGILAAGFFANVVLATILLIYVTRAFTSRVGILIDNAERLEHGEALREPLDATDELGFLDNRFHQMADAIAAGQRALQESNAELESFSYSVSHDLRAPLRAISGYAQMLEEDCGPYLDDEGRRYLFVIRNEAHRLGVLIDELLTFSRLSRGQLSIAPVNLEELARDVFPEAAHGTDARLEIDGELPVAPADRNLLRQVLVNLFSNAVKFSRKAGEIVVQLGAERRERDVVYWVRDRGVGFDPRYAHKLFGVFQRLHDDSEFEGTGVGLAIVRRVVHRHGGDVWAESDLGRGATFYFSIPVQEEAAG